jgi:transposase
VDLCLSLLNAAGADTPSDFRSQLWVQRKRSAPTGTIEYTINYLVDNEIDLSVFHQRFHNDENGAPGFDPAVLLKIVLFAYARGIIGSRKIAQCCEENIVFMALSADGRRHFTTIAQIVSMMDERFVSVFTDVLTICYREGLIGRRMFASDGCKIAANCAKEWGGTKKELLKKAQEIEGSIGATVKKHRDDERIGNGVNRSRATSSTMRARRCPAPTE